MQQLFDFLRRWNYVFLFVVLEAVSGVLLFRFNHYQGSVYLTAANGANALLGRWYDDTHSFINLRKVNKHLTEENIRLNLQNEILRRELAQANHETTHTEEKLLEQLLDYTLIPATVVSNEIRSQHNYIVVNKGHLEGIRPEMGVVSGGGIVGIVYLCGPHHSLVMPIINPKSSISCRVREQEYFGYLQWDGHSSHHAYLDEIPRYAKVKPGMTIETSGYSAVFPPGLFVGRVTKVENSSDGQSYRLSVNLGTDFASLRDVNIIATSYKSEIDTLKAHIFSTNN